MIKKLLFSIGALICAVSLVQAQSLQEVNARVINDMPNRLTKSLAGGGVLCGEDTLAYAITKATGLSAISLNNATSATALSQYFDCPQPVTVSGASFYAYKIDETNGITMNTTLEIFMAGADSLPMGSPIASATITIDTAFGGGSLTVLRKHANFSPVSVSAPYCMVVSNPSATPMGFVVSSYADNDGAGEWLSAALIGANWIPGYNVVLGPNDYDADALIEPHVTYDLTADYDLNGNCVPSNTPATWTNTSSPILYNRMYSVAAFLALDSLQTTWDYGDGTPISYSIDGSHTYTTGGPPWTVTLTDSLFGWSVTCVDDHVESTGGFFDPAFTSSVSDLEVTFNNTTVINNQQNVLWDFGDGNTSFQSNPVHNYAASGFYTVCMTVVGECMTDSSCAVVDVSIVTDVEDREMENLSVYPNPSDGTFTLQLSGVETAGAINLFDVTGRLVYTEAVIIGQGFRKTIDLDLNTGTYLLELATAKGVVVRRIQIE